MKFHCPHCTQKLQINDRLAGKTVRCPNCNHRLTVPASAAPERKAAAGARQTRQSKSISVRRQPAGKGTPKPAAMPKSAAKESAAAPPPPSPSLPPTSAPPMPGKRVLSVFRESLLPPQQAAVPDPQVPRHLRRGLPAALQQPHRLTLELCCVHSSSLTHLSSPFPRLSSGLIFVSTFPGEPQISACRPNHRSLRRALLGLPVL